MEFKKHESTVRYEIIRDDGTIMDSKDTFPEAIDAAIKYSNVCSNLFTIRTIKIEVNDEFAFQLGKVKY